MKYKYLLLLILGFSGFSANKWQRTATDTTNMILVKTGLFYMGIDSVQRDRGMQKYNVPANAFSHEYSKARVQVHSFYLDKYEVTNADFKKFIDANPIWSKFNIPGNLHDGNYLKDWKDNKYPKSKGNCPVVYVCWYAANAYAQWKGKRLPGETEMEFAAKGNISATAEFPWGGTDADTTKANYKQSNTGHPVPVGHYPPNNLGLFDMAGNVFEFCADMWRPNHFLDMDNYKKKRLLFPTPGVPDNQMKTVRGGSWNSPAIELRTTYREGRFMTSCSDDVGFRCAISDNQ